MNRRIVDAVLFDLDGTLIDSIGIYYRILDTAFDRLGLPRASREKIAEAAGDGDFNWELVLPEAPESDKGTLIATVQKSILGIYPGILERELRLIPGAASVLEAISRQNIKIALVTSTPTEAMPYKLRPLKEAGVDTLFAAVITADDVNRKKPHAEPLIAGAGRLGVEVSRSVCVGDSRVDIRAGKAAGMKTVGVLTGFDDRETLAAEAPDALVQSVRELPEILAAWLSP